MSTETTRQNKRIIRLATIVIIVATIAMVLQFMVLYEIGVANASQVFVIASTVIMQMAALLVVVLHKTKTSLEVVSKLAYADELTGLINRRRFNQLLNEQLEINKSTGSDCAVLILDLDRFKVINDCHGHDAGDKIICQFGDRIQEASGENAVTCRMSGDEFAVMLPVVTSKSEVDSVCRNVLQIMKQPFIYEGKKINASVSIGAAIIDGTENETLTPLRMADFALLNSKNNGRNQFKLFDSSMANRISRRRHLEAGLSDAIARRKLTLKYQPFVLQESSSISGVEALIRWDDPVIGEIYPAEFIPVAQELGLIEKMGEFILEQACSEIKPFDGIRLAVNISTAQFTHEGFVKQVRRVLNKTGFEPDRLELELGQNLLVSNSTKIRKDLEALRELGVRIVLDDFGTSYASMFFLRDFKLDRIKLDRNFVTNMRKERDGNDIIENMIGLGSTFSDRLTVEGVETQEQYENLKQNGVNELQGFLFSEPLTLEELAASKMMEEHGHHQKEVHKASNVESIRINRLAG